MKNGFTLVELSIVLVIIGLLVGGVLVGQSMIESVKTNRLVSDLRQYEIATVQFRNKFKRYPGDSQFFSPPGAPNDALGSGDSNGDGLADIAACNGALSNTEEIQVWAHLSQAKMLTKNYVPFSPQGVCTGGVHAGGNTDKSLDGIIAPFTEYKVGSFTKYPIRTYKVAGGNFYFNLVITPPTRVLAIENKLGSQNYNGTQKQVGLANSYDVGNCGNISYSPVLCSGPTAASGTLLYYLAPP